MQVPLQFFFPLGQAQLPLWQVFPPEQSPLLQQAEIEMQVPLQFFVPLGQSLHPPALQT